MSRPSKNSLSAKAAKNFLVLVEKRRAELGQVRDKLRDDMETMEALKESAETAYDDLERVIEELSKYA